MSEISIALIVLFASVALLTGTATSAILGRSAPGRRRLFALGGNAKDGLFVNDPLLVDTQSEEQKRLAAVLFTINPEHLSTLTRSQLGLQLIMTGIVLQIIGSLIVRKLVQIEY